MGSLITVYLNDTEVDPALIWSMRIEGTQATYSEWSDADLAAELESRLHLGGVDALRSRAQIDLDTIFMIIEMLFRLFSKQGAVEALSVKDVTNSIPSTPGLPGAVDTSKPAEAQPGQALNLQTGYVEADKRPIVADQAPALENVPPVSSEGAPPASQIPG